MKRITFTGFPAALLALLFFLTAFSAAAGHASAASSVIVKKSGASSHPVHFICEEASAENEDASPDKDLLSGYAFAPHFTAPAVPSIVPGSGAICTVLFTPHLPFFLSNRVIRI